MDDYGRGTTELSLSLEAPAFCQILLLATRSPLPYYTGLKTSSYSVIHVFNKHSMTGADSTLGPVLDTSTEPVYGGGARGHQNPGQSRRKRRVLEKILWVVAGAELVQCLPSGISDPVPILQKSLVLTMVAEASLVCRASPRTAKGTQRNNNKKI